VHVQVPAVPAARRRVIQPDRRQLHDPLCPSHDVDLDSRRPELASPPDLDHRGTDGDLDDEVVTVKERAAVIVVLARDIVGKPGAAALIPYPPPRHRIRHQA
jgi:hypothetical protein